MNIEILKTTTSLKDIHTFITDALLRNITVDEIISHLKHEIVDSPMSHFYVNPEEVASNVLFCLDLLIHACGSPIERKKEIRLKNHLLSLSLKKKESESKKALSNDEPGYCKKIAELGLPHFQYNYGMYCVSVAEGDADLVEAFKWIKLSSENGHVLALYVLSLMYLIGIGTTQDKELARDLMKNAAELSVFEAGLALDGIFKDDFSAEYLTRILEKTINDTRRLSGSTLDSKWGEWIATMGTWGNTQHEFIKKTTDCLYSIPGHQFFSYGEMQGYLVSRLFELSTEQGNLRKALKYAEESIKLIEYPQEYGLIKKISINKVISLKNQMGEPIDMEYAQTFEDSGISVEDSTIIYRIALENKNKLLEEANKELQQKEKELEDLMAMFAHKFRSPLDAIMYNISHGNDSNIYARNAQTMQGLLNIFGLISTDQKVLVEKLAKDNSGKGNLTGILTNVLDMLLLHLLTEAGAEKIHQHFLAFARREGKVPSDTVPAVWYEEYFELEDEIRTSWQRSYASLVVGSISLEDRLEWIEERFFRLDVSGFDIDISFKRYGTTESFLTIIINEILTNLFKYYSSPDVKEPASFSLKDTDARLLSIACSNPSTKAERLEAKGSYKGHTFLAALARKTGAIFRIPELNDDFHVKFSIPKSLLF